MVDMFGTRGCEKTCRLCWPIPIWNGDASNGGSSRLSSVAVSHGGYVWYPGSLASTSWDACAYGCVKACEQQGSLASTSWDACACGFIKACGQQGRFRRQHQFAEEVKEDEPQEAQSNSFRTFRLFWYYNADD